VGGNRNIYRDGFGKPQKAQNFLLFPIVSFVVLTLLLLSSSLLAQEVNGSLTFSQKTLTLGEVVPVRMEIFHPDNVVLVFPDSTYDISPFEWVRSVPEPTVTENGLSKDAITYFVRTLGLQEKLVLRLPYAHVVDGDTFRTFEESDTITLRKQVLTLSPMPPFRGNDALLRVSDPPNYLLLGGIAVAVISLLVLLAFAMRKPLHRYWARRRLQKEWQSIQRRLKTLKKKPPAAAEYLDSLNHIWKDYLDPKGQYALRSLTTTELAPVLKTMPEVPSGSMDLLLHAASAGDRVIYAGEPMLATEILGLLGEISGVLEGVYLGRVREVRVQI
jgi:hypothetical protein